MPVCAPGISQPKAAYAGTVYVSAAAAEAFLLRFVGRDLAVVLSAAIAGDTYSLIAFCGSDPPADPNLTATDILNYLQLLNPLLRIQAALKIRQWFQSQFWYIVCECNPPKTLTPPAPTVPPPVGINPGIPPGPSQGNCWDVKKRITLTSSVSSIDFSSQLIPTDVPVSGMVPGGGFQLTTAYPVPAGFGTGSVTTTMTDSDNSVQSLYFVFYTSAKAFITQEALFTDAPNTHGPNPFTIPGNAAYWVLEWASNGFGGARVDWTMEVSWTCTGTPPGGIVQPCCPPDPTLMLQVDQLLSMVTAIYQGLPSALRSYSEGNVHAGLSANGTFTLIGSQTIAIKVALTTDNPAYGNLGGQPTYLLDRGFVVPVTNEAPLHPQTRVVYNPQLFMLPPLTQQIGFSFNAGIVASITELSPGP